MKKYLILWAGLFSLLPVCAQQKDSISSVVDEVIWVVGDEAILKSEVEVTRIQAAMEGMRWNGDPDCAIPEHLAVQKLFLHQAAIDSIEVKETEISAATERRLDYMIQQIGSREKLEEYRKQSMSQMRQSMHDDLRDQLLIQRMKEHLVKDLVVTPAEVRRYFKNMPTDSIPYVPTEVEVQIVALTPRVSIEEINRVKDELRDYTDRINKGETSFSTLARLYSEDPGSRRQGGELDYTGRGLLDPAFAAVAFNLTDPTKVSKIVESEFGYHIIQLIDKRGDKIKVRHILRKPVVSDSAVNICLSRLDTIADAIRANVVPEMIRSQLITVPDHFSFEDAVTVFSDDKDTRNNRGLMANRSESGQTSRFQLQDLPPEVAKVVDTLKVGQISAAFPMINDQGKTVCVIAKLKSRTEGHKATITEDFQVMKELVMEKRREKMLHDWVVQKIKSTYVRLGEDYKDCQFEYEGWNR
ncbi:peptidylprolyl isomerase [uncultured Prevotella sp.]|uniref:peptidylprolyl isomerase n=1 Tax=uncultured Prevotella sp. TaxID=159272 RepID=UPI002600E4F7|nr:peptidylprolyl isomerase [uncultured Prevotella sp.]